MDFALEIDGLSKRYKGFSLQDVGFSLPRGYIMGLIGPNGAGKTTIIKLIMNLIRRDAGRIRVLGRDNIADEVAIKSRIGFVYDTPCFHEDCSLKRLAAAISPFYESWDRKRFEALVSEFELPLDQQFKKLSQGMKTQFALALALSHDADLILMDEPTSGLDPVFRRTLLEKLSGLLQDENKSILFSTHITSDLERIADYITCIRDGQVVLSATRDEFRERWGILRGGQAAPDAALNGLLQSFTRGAFGWEALTCDLPAARRLQLPDVIAEPASLEDIVVFLGRENNLGEGGHA